MSEALSNEQHQPQPRQYTPAPNRRYAEEDRAWSQLYAAIGQTSTAEEVVKQLDADLQSKRTHLALYIRARTTLREQKAADVRNQRIGAFLRDALDLMVLGPLRLLRAALTFGAGVAVEALPPVRREPAKARTSVLRSDPDFAHAKDRFASGADVPGTAASEAGESRSAKAA
jgi:hypothetical protein